MSRAIPIFRAVLLTFAVTALLCPLPVHGQQAPAAASSAGTNFDPVMPSLGSLAEAAKPVVPNPFERPSSSRRKTTDDGDSSGSLLLQLDRKWITAVAQYGFAAPPAFYSFGHNESGPSDWDSDVSGAVTTFVNRSFTTYVRMSSDFEVQGQKREAGAAGDPGAQTFTMEWELAHLVPSRLGPMEIATGRYQQQLVSYAAFANSPLASPFLGYSGSASGFETSVTLPDKNLTFTFRRGTERQNATAGKSHATQVEFSWTW